MEFRVLGPLEAWHGGRKIPLGSRKQRAVLAILLLRANEVVSPDALIDELWGEHAPPSAPHTLQAYISRLRTTLRRSGVDGVLVTRPGGYLLRVGFDELDLHRFDRLVDEGRRALAAGSFDRAADRLHVALQLWRGSPLADLAFEPFARVDAERLEERRLGVLEDRLEAELAGGAHARLVPELEGLVAQHPLRERFREQLMLALYRSGRQADALDAYRDARDYLVDELGLEPSRKLRALERAILEQDDALELPAERRAKTAVLTAEDAADAPSSEPAGARPAEPAPRRAGPRRWQLAGAATILGGLVVAAAVGLTKGGSSPLRGVQSQTNRLLALDGTLSVLTDARLPGPPADVAVAGGSVWAAEPDAQRIVRIDSSSGAVSDRVAVPAQPSRLAVGGGALWVASALAGRLSRIDPETGEVTQVIPLFGASPTDVVFAKGVVWVADAASRALIPVDAATGAVGSKVALDIAPTALAAGGGQIWVAGYGAGVVEQVDPRSRRAVATIAVGQGPAAIVVARRSVWVANGLDATVSRIDALAGSVRATIPVPGRPTAIAALPDSVWIACEEEGRVIELDPHRNAVRSFRRLGGRPQALASTGGRLWVAAGSSARSHHGGTLTILRTGRFASVDPAFVLESDRQFTRLVYDTLVTFQAAPGPNGLRLLPDLAVSVPKPTHGGTVYAFRVRPGLRYSDGRRVRARDFRRAIERLFRVQSTGASYYAGLIGAEACVARPEECRLARGIETNDASRTVVFRLRSPDADFLAKLTVLGFSTPVPAGVPDHDVGLNPFPATGPYRFGQLIPGEIRFVRNRFFREWSSAAQPAGNPDSIVWRTVKSQQAAVAEVVRGTGDWLFDAPPPAELRSLRLRYPSQLHVNPSTSVAFFPLNTRKPPFDDERVRRAFNFAIDRRKIARWYGGPAVAAPLCQPLAPGLPGHRPYCPYTIEPRRGGRWKAPDLVRARRLVAASGTRGQSIDLWGSSDWGVPPPLPRYVADTLRSLGYRVRLHLVPYDRVTLAMRRDLQLSIDGNWMPDYPAASAYLPQFFGCSGGNGNGYFCDRAIDRRMQRASLLQLTDPVRAAALWTDVDHELTDRAAWVPTVNVRTVELVSKRVRNYQFSPVGGFIAHQAWLR